MRTLIGVSGASGAIFAVDLIKHCPGERFLIVSKWGAAVLEDELGLTVPDLAPLVRGIFADDDLAAPFSSGTNRCDAMVIVPCSVSTLSKIACGIADTLITRSAHVALKERTRLILALRETPLSTGALENALKLSREGAIIAPIMPPFYAKPKTVDEVVAGYTDKLLALLGGKVHPGWRAESLES
jgi:flavin prenyltransferase